MKIAILGAQGSGKTQLAYELSSCLRSLNDMGSIIADAPPLMAAIHCDSLYDDNTLCELALTQHKIYDLTLLCGLDIPCRSGLPGHERSSSREAVDAQLRVALARGNIAYTVIYGQGPARLEAAFKAVSSWRDDRVKPNAVGLRQRQWSCEKCSDPECEHRLFTGLLKIAGR